MKLINFKPLMVLIISLFSATGLAQQKETAAEIEKLKTELKAANERAAKAEAMAIASMKLAEEKRKEAQAALKNAEIAEKSAQRCRYIAQAKAIARKTIELDDYPETQALTAQLAYKFYMRNLGQQPDEDIYNGLFHALQRMKDPIINQVDKEAWPANVDAMSKSLCGHLNRNMTKEEWINFVGNDLPYELVCDKQ